MKGKAELQYPKELKYSKTHEWIKEDEEGNSIIGVTDYAQKELGDIVFIDMPEVGDDVIMGDSFADIESVKAVVDINSPVSGTIMEVNEELLDAPELLNDDPYESWIVKIKDVTETEEIIDADAYRDYCETLED